MSRSSNSLFSWFGDIFIDLLIDLGFFVKCFLSNGLSGLGFNAVSDLSQDLSFLAVFFILPVIILHSVEVPDLFGWLGEVVGLMMDFPN